MNSEILGCSIVDRSVLKTKYIHHVSRIVTGFRKKGAVTEPFKMTTEVIILPNGSQIIPYFKDSKGRWKIVLVSQYRAAIRGKTLEGAGGRLEDGEAAETALSRELEEETTIKVKPRSIRIIFYEYMNSSIIVGTFYGGIVKINAGAVKNKTVAGKKTENEQTQVEIFDLVEFIKKRESGLVRLDLLTSRLIDEVAKVTGLLVRKY